uniref:Uncharacterized protein n=1 Tax=Parascaris univalens TaxID=6257 RepID=A0A914ZV55_PARUN
SMLRVVRSGFDKRRCTYNCRRYLHDTTSSSPSNTLKNDVTTHKETSRIKGRTRWESNSQVELSFRNCAGPTT